MRENNLLSDRCRRRGGNPHVGEIITHAPNLMWGTDGVRVFTVDANGWGWIFTAIEHWNAECVGWHVCKRGDRFAALQPISMGLARLYASTSAGAARGLALRMDHGSQYLSDHFHQPDQVLVSSTRRAATPHRRTAPDQRHRREVAIARSKESRSSHGRIYRNIAELRNAVRGFVEQTMPSLIVRRRTATIEHGLKLVRCGTRAMSLKARRIETNLRPRNLSVQAGQYHLLARPRGSPRCFQ